MATPFTFIWGTALTKLILKLLFCFVFHIYDVRTFSVIIELDLIFLKKIVQS